MADPSAARASKPMRAGVALACLLAAAFCGCSHREVADWKGDDDTALLYVARWTAVDEATGTELGHGCVLHPEPFAFPAEPGQVVLVDAQYEAFVMTKEEWTAAPEHRDLWCAKKGSRPAGWLPDPSSLTRPPMADSCVDRQSARVLDSKLVPDGATVGNADGYQARFEILRKGDFCRVCVGDPYKGCSVISVQ